ncbi:MAG TPA: sodium-dependent bicarbonate transport family permease, partial [Pseudomonadales bacterium]
TYGSVSAVTFVTTTSYLDAAGIAWSGYLVAAMALMESPAIIIGILLYRLFRENGKAEGRSAGIDWRELTRESMLNGSVFLLMGSMLIGWITGPAGMLQVKGLVGDLFIGILCLFLLDMGIVAARRLQEFNAGSARRAASGAVLTMAPGTIIGLALVLPLVNATIGGALALLLGLDEGDALLLTVLAASASYIAVPAAMRLALPEANPGMYLPMSLAVTFPLNLIVGIPGYHLLIRWITAG